MGIFSKIGQKIGDAMEKSASKNLSGESKEAYEKEKMEKELAKQNAIPDPVIDITFEKDELKNLNDLVYRGKFVDENRIWVAGFSNHKSNQNASAANLFSGKKNLRFFTVHGEQFYFAHFQDNHFKSYKVFKSENIKKAEVKTKLLGAATLFIQLHEGTTLTIDITENKEVINTLKDMFK